MNSSEICAPLGAGQSKMPPLVLLTAVAKTAGTLARAAPTAVSAPHRLLLFYCFFLDHHFEVGGYVFVQLDGNRELAQGLQWFVKLDLATINIEPLFVESISDIARGN